MRGGDVTLALLPQANGRSKLRPAILLRQMPPFGDRLVCGVSSQLQQEEIGFDDVIRASHLDFQRSGLKKSSLIRLGFLVSLPVDQLTGIVGSISSGRHRLLLQRLGAFLVKEEVL